MLFTSLWKKLGALGTGIAFTELVNHFVDLWMFPAVIAWLGVWIGWPVLLVFCLVLNYINILAYRESGVGEILDWLVRIKSAKDLGRFERMLGYCLKMGHVPFVLALTFEDPAKGFVYARAHVLSQGFSLKDWFWYFWANVLGVSIWVWSWAGIIAGLKWLWHWLVG